MTRLTFGMVACLFAKPFGKQKTLSKKKRHKSKESSITNTNKEKWEQNMSKGEGSDFKIINLDLKPHLVSLLSSGRGGHHATPLR